LPASRQLEIVRGYWQIANSLHFIKVHKRHVSAGEIRDIQSMLLGEIRSLWPELYTCHES